MEIAASFLCDAASVREGLLNVLGAGIARIHRESYPAQLQAHFAVLIELHRMEMGKPHEMEIVIQDADGKRLFELQGGFEAGVGPDAEVQEKALVPLALNLAGVEIERQGAHSIELSIDSQHRRTINFRAMLRPSEGSPTPNREQRRHPAK